MSGLERFFILTGRWTPKMSKNSEYVTKYCKMSEYYIKIVREQMFVHIRSPVQKERLTPNDRN